MSTDVVAEVLGPTGTALGAGVAEVLCDADVRTIWEQARRAGAVVRVTRRGRLIRATDIGHAPGPMVCACTVCGQPWPCSSRVLEAVAMGDLL